MELTQLFNVLVSILLLICGFLLYRVFAEIDKLHTRTNEFKEIVFREFVSQAELNKHEALELRLIEKISIDMKARFDKVDAILETLRK